MALNITLVCEFQFMFSFSCRMKIVKLEVFMSSLTKRKFMVYPRVFFKLMYLIFK